MTAIVRPTRSRRTHDLIERVTGRELIDSDGQVAAYIEEHGVNVCPPAAAAVLGVSTPGWRRSVERARERRNQFNRGKGGGGAFGIETKRQNAASHVILAEQLGARAIIDGHPLPATKAGHRQYAKDVPRVYCRYFDKTCLIKICKTDEQCSVVIAEMTNIYGKQGARFFISHEFIPCFTDWKTGVKPRLIRAYKRSIARTED